MTFNLPNGNEPSEIRLPNGVSASEVKDPLGNTVWSAIPDSLVDNFEEILYEDQGKTLTDYYGGDLAEFDRQQSTVLEGEFSLEASASEQNKYGISSTAGLNTYPTTDDSFGVYLQIGNITDDFQSKIAYATQSEAVSGADFDGYHVTIAQNVGTLRLEKWDSGSFTLIDDASVTWSNYLDERLDAQITWGGDESHSVTLYDGNDSAITTVSGSDGTYVSGGIGYAVNALSNDSSVTAQFDNVRLLA